MNKKLILASGSPRRTELLTQIELPHTVIIANVEEKMESSAPDELVRSLSDQKCRAVAERLFEDAVVIGADTVVSLRGEILGKPTTEAEAEEMLTELQGRTHEVYTGVTMIECSGKGGAGTNTGGAELLRETSFHVCTQVSILPMSREEILWYVKTQEPMDKAGAYGIQGPFARFVESISGDYFNVMGLPVHAIYRELKKWNFFEGG